MLVAVGGHSRNIGKTSVTEGLIRKLRDRKWTALKITQYGNAVCAHHEVAAGCGCEPDNGEEFALTEEYEATKTDSGRFLAAGAERSFWLRVPAGELPRAAETVNKILRQNENTIVESNSIRGAGTAGSLSDAAGFRLRGFQAIQPALHGPGRCLRGDRPRDQCPIVGGRGSRHVGQQAAIPGSAAALRHASAGRVRNFAARCYFRALNPRAAKLRRGRGEHSFSSLHLTLDQSQLLANARIGGGERRETPHTGFDVAERLPEIVNQVGESGFGCVEEGHGSV